MTQKNTDYKLKLLAADPRCRYCDKQLLPVCGLTDYKRSARHRRLEEMENER